MLAHIGTRQGTAQCRGDVACLACILPGDYQGKSPVARTSERMAHYVALVPALPMAGLPSCCSVRVQANALLNRAICWPRNVVSWAWEFASVSSKWRGQGRLRSPLRTGRDRCLGHGFLHVPPRAASRSLTHSNRIFVSFLIEL